MDKGSAHKIDSPENLIAADQSLVRMGTSNKTKKMAISITPMSVINFVTMMELEILKNLFLSFMTQTNVLITMETSIFFKEYVGEELFTPFIPFSDIENFYLIQVIDLLFQVDQINPKNVQLFEQKRAAPGETRLFFT